MIHTRMDSVLSSGSARKAPSLRLCRIVTVPMTFATLLREQLQEIIKTGIDLTLISSPGPELLEISSLLPARCFTVPMARKPALWSDLRALSILAHFFQQERFDIVHSSTPKAGLLAALAGTLARVPVRIHTYTGQVWADMSGPLRWVVRNGDAMIGRLATQCYADSLSQRDFLVREGIVRAHKVTVLGAGSIGGVDLRRFNPDEKSLIRIDKRRRLGIPLDARVIIFVGRVTKDKGIRELISAFGQLSRSYDDLHLVLVGPQELERDPLFSNILAEIDANSQVHQVGFSSHPEEYYAMADIFCLPSYREGFGSVAIEAGAMGLPAVATRVTGLIDAIVDGQTGILVPAKDPAALAAALRRLIESPELRARLGRAARRRIVEHFDAADINQKVVMEYARLVESR